MASTSNVSTGLSVNLSTGEVQSGHIQFRNRIINGDMRINQRGTTIYRVGNGGINGNYTGDRWKCWRDTGTNAGYFNISYPYISDLQNHSNAMLLTNINTGSGLSPTWNGVAQIIEGYSIADLNWGKSYAYPITLSFWAKSSIPGTYGIICGNVGNGGPGNNMYGGRYTITNSNTWQYITHTIIPPPVSSQWDNNNLSGISIMYTFANMDSGVGYTTYRLSTDGWSIANNCWAVVGQISWATTNNATFYLTGVQLEKGTKATPFEFRPYSIELALCQRYTYAITGGGTVGTSIYVGRAICQATNVHFLDIPLPVPMRAIPAITLSANSVLTLYFTVHTGITTASITGAQYYSTNQNVARLYINGSGSGSVAYPEEAYIGATTAGSMVLSAEL